jgi:competence protein ComEA
MAGFFSPPTSRRPHPAASGPVTAPLPPVPPGRPGAAVMPRKLTFRERFAEGVEAMALQVRSRLGRFGAAAAVAAVALVVAAVGVAWTLHARAQSDPVASRRSSDATGSPLATLPLISAPEPTTGSERAAAASGGQTGTALASAPGSAGAAAPSPTAGPAVTIAVHAAGAVLHPGVYLFAEGARVDDVIGAAGGLQPDADPDVINLAARVRDAERVFVPRVGRTVPAVQTGSPTGATGSADGTGADSSIPALGPIDINTANAAQLDALPGVGPATAAAILEFRRTHGRFRSVTQLLDVPGIGDAKLAALRSKVTVSA